MGKNTLYLIVPFCSIFILVGGGLMFYTGRKILLGIKAKQWPQTIGQLQSAETKETHDSEGSSSREILVHYTYNVNGIDYEGNTIHPAYTSSGFENAHSQLEALLKPAKQVAVYYHPSQPGRSTLSAGFYSCTLASFFGGFIFMAVGVGFLLTFWFAITGTTNFADSITVMQ